MTALGIVLMVIGVAACGLGIAGRIKAAQALGPGGAKSPFKRSNPIYEAKRLYEMPDHGAYVRELVRSGNRLIVTGISLVAVGLVVLV